MSRRAAAAPAPTPRPGTGRSAPELVRRPASVWRRRRGCGGPNAGQGGGRQGVRAWCGGIISVMSLPFSLSGGGRRIGGVLGGLSRFRWKTSAQTLRERFRADHLGLTASSLTFTTILALVPFFTVALAVFTAFPIFGQLQDALQGWLVSSLVPDSIARQVLGYLTQFAAKASGLGLAGFSVLLVTALALILTIDRTLNDI